MLIKTLISPESLLPIAADTAEFLCGIEYEIEDIRDHKTPLQVLLDAGKISIHNDGSLRNNGKEFVTSPLSISAQLYVYKQLYEGLKLGPKPHSERTSIHVHVNVANLTEEAFKTFVHLYILLEPSFFYYAGEARKNNIHCVPLSYTFLASKYKSRVISYPFIWSKYTAFNLIPVRTQNTVEFRHAPGYNDPARLEHWLNLIKSLYDESRKPFSVQAHLESKTSVRDIHRLIFKEECPLPESAYQESLIDLKLAYV